MYSYPVFPEVGKPIQIHVDPNVKLVNLKTPAPVPLHCIGRNRWKSSVTWCWARSDWTCATQRTYKMVFRYCHFSLTNNTSIIPIISVPNISVKRVWDIWKEYHSVPSFIRGPSSHDHYNFVVTSDISEHPKDLFPVGMVLPDDLLMSKHWLRVIDYLDPVGD